MTIASEIQRIKTNIANTYTVLEEKGATIPATKNSNNLSACAETVQTGSTINNQDITVTQNGTYTAESGYTGLGEVTVSIPSDTVDIPNLKTVYKFSNKSASATTVNGGSLLPTLQKQVCSHLTEQ